MDNKEEFWKDYEERLKNYEERLKNEVVNPSGRLKNTAIIEQSEKQKEFAIQRNETYKQNGTFAPSLLGVLDIKNYYKSYTGKRRKVTITDIIGKAGLNEYATPILSDWGAAVCGDIRPACPPDVMRAAVQKINPLAAYNADKYVFYTLIFHTYAGILRELDWYNDFITGDTDERAKYIESFDASIPLPTFFYKYYCLQFGYIDLIGLGATVNQVKRIKNKIQFAGERLAFYNLYYIAKYALNVTAKELSNIPPPRGKKDIERDYLATCECYCDDTQEILKREGDWLKSGNTSFLSRSLAQIASAENLKYCCPNAPDDVIGEALLTKIANDIPDCMGRPIYPAAMGVINGINLFLNKGDCIQPGYNNKGERGRNYEIHTSITKFAKNCGYKEPNGEQLKQLQNAMFCLHNMQFIYTAKNKRVCGPPIAFQTVPNKPESSNPLTILVPVQYCNTQAEKLFVNENQILSLMSAQIGREQRLNNILLLTNHKEETALLKQVYDYTGEYNEAERAGTVVNYVKNWNKNEKQYLKQLHKWFENAKKKGMILDFSRAVNANGKSYVWSWKKTQPNSGENEGKNNGKNEEKVTGKKSKVTGKKSKITGKKSKDPL